MILDTNGLSPVADGDLTIEPVLREASDIAVPVIVLFHKLSAALLGQNRGAESNHLAIIRRIQPEIQRQDRLFDRCPGISAR